MKKTDYIVTLLGYTQQSHTHYWPQSRFYETIKSLGIDVEWTDLQYLKATKRPRIYVCWNSPTCEQLVAYNIYDEKKGDVLLQKLTSLGLGDEHANWGTDAFSFYKTWTWNTYKKVERLFDSGKRIYAFGCKTISEPFPEKHRIVTKLTDRIFWVNWGPCLYSMKQLQEARPIMSNFRYDIGYVGMLWGSVGRGNADAWDMYMKGLIKEFPNSALAGSGNPLGRVSNDIHENILKSSRVCPVIHCPSWIAEKGCQSRTYDVYASGRFGVIDNPGIYEYFDKDDVVCATDPIEYADLTKYYIKNVDKQLPYIEKFLKRIQSDLNWTYSWNKIIDSIAKDN